MRGTTVCRPRGQCDRARPSARLDLYPQHLETAYVLTKGNHGAGHEGKVTGLALLPDWTLASVSHDRTIRLWDLHTFKLINTVQDAHATPLQGIDYSPDANEVVTFAMDNLAYVWDAVRLQAKYALVGHTAEVTQVRHAFLIAFG